MPHKNPHNLHVVRNNPAKELPARIQLDRNNEEHFQLILRSVSVAALISHSNLLKRVDQATIDAPPMIKEILGMSGMGGLMGALGLPSPERMFLDMSIQDHGGKLWKEIGELFHLDTDFVWSLDTVTCELVPAHKPPKGEPDLTVKVPVPAPEV